MNPFTKVKLINYTPNYLEIISGAMGKCYEKTVGTKGVLSAIEAGHLSILEHAYATFDIECSLAVLGQLTRHRHLSFTVMSTRGSKMDDYFIPESILNNPVDYKIFIQTMDTSFKFYNILLSRGVPYEDAAYVLPKGTITKLRVTGDLRAWFEYLPKRLCKRAMPEHRVIARKILDELSLVIPEVFNRDFCNCSKCNEHNCSFRKV